jgi:two-component system NtrC family sensor kinase
MPVPDTTDCCARLLVLDDEPLVCELFLDVARSARFDPCCASGAGEIAASLSGRYDAAIVDLHLGQLDVLDVLTRLGENSPGCDVALITGSALSSTGVAAGWARSCGLNVVAELQKPVSLPELRRVLGSFAASAAVVA